MLDRTATAPAVPISYVWLLLELAGEHGVPASKLLDGLDFPADLLNNPDARMPLRPEYAEVCRRALALSGEPGLGYEFGLRASLTTHGIVGYGFMSQANLRQVLEFGQRFGSVLRLSAWNLHFFQADGQVCMRAVESIEPNDLYRFSAQQVLVSCYTMLLQLIPECRGEVTLHFNTPEPAYQARYARRLPTCHFMAPFNELRLPERFLDIPLRTADRISAQLSERACSRELQQMDSEPVDALIRRVRTMLVPGSDGYPALEDLARQMNVSARTLARQLQERGTSYRDMLQQAQRRDSLTLLRDPQLSISEVAFRLGYSSVTNFTRACKSWHGQPPAQLRSTTDSGHATWADSP